MSEPLPFQTETVDRTPEGAVRVKRAEVFVYDGQVIIVGEPDDNDEGHNCDEMGCATFSHVVMRFPLRRAPSAPAQTPEWIAEYVSRLDAFEAEAILAENAHPAHQDEAQAKRAVARFRLNSWVLGTGKEGEE